MSRAPRVIGVDTSLTGTGLADGETWSHVVDPKKLVGHERLQLIVNAVAQAVSEPDVVLAVIEGPSYGSKGSAVHQIAGLWWLVAHELWARNVPYAMVTPQNRAKYATGRSGANKDEVLAAVIRRWPEFHGTSNNAADAWILATMGRVHLGLPGREVPALNREAMTKVSWPEVPVLAGEG